MNKQDAAVVRLTDEQISEIYQATWNEDGLAVRKAPTTPEMAIRFARNILKQSLAQPQSNGKPTDISKRLREYSSNPGYSHNDYADTMLAAAEEIERYYGGMLAWKASAEAKDAAAAQSQAPVVPEGWKMVPIEADHKMRDAGAAAFVAKGLFDDIFRAMTLAAPGAPKPEPSQRDEQALAVQEYSTKAFDYPKGLVGSRDWRLYWEGWQACAASKGKS